MKQKIRKCHGRRCMLPILVAVMASAHLAYAGNIWYVAPAPIGDDSYDGTSSNHVSGTVGPRRTLAKAMELAKSWDTVVALPGVYDAGSYEGSEANYARVHVPGNVKLVSTDGPERTFIVGKAADAGNELDAHGTGPGALRGVVLNGTIEGFTICGGRVRSKTVDGDVANGGGILAIAEGALAVNCIVSNNVANRGGGMYGNYRTSSGTNNRYNRAVNCRFLSNAVFRSGSGTFYIDAWNCLYSGNGGTAYANATARNCTILDGYSGAKLLNSILSGTDGGSCYYTNSITVSLDAGSTLGSGSVQTTVAGTATGADCRPSAETNVGIDRGDYRYYEESFPSGAAHFKDKDIRGFARVAGEAIDIGAGEYAPLDLYVDAGHGDDSNDAVAPGAGRARRTMAGVFAYRGIASGDVVHAAPGVYNEGLMGMTGYTTNRVLVPAGVGLVADEGPEVTIIEGAAATNSGNSKNCGQDAVRCVSLSVNAWIKGFTFRNGATAIPDNYNDVGGGVCGDAASFTVGCIFRNCSAKRGGGACGGSYVDCNFDSSLQASMEQTTGGYNANGYYGCLFNGASAYGNIGRVVNCSFFGGWCGGNSTWPHVYNTYVGKDLGKCYFHRCIVGTAAGSGSTGDDGTLFSQTSGILYDLETCRPVEGSLLVDFGDSCHWKTNFPSGFPRRLSDVRCEDVAGGQRIYNGSIDAGAGEFDWRGRFARYLSKQGVSVSAAGEGVKLDSGGLHIPDGDSISSQWAFQSDAQFRAFAEWPDGGTFSLESDGERASPNVNGVYSLLLPEGSHELVFSYSGPAAATLVRCSVLRGFYLYFR